MLPPTILTEAIAQVGAILILAKPENREKLTFFMGIERVRYRRPVHPGDVVVIEATVRRLRSRMGVLSGIARVDGRGGRRRDDDVRPRPAHGRGCRRVNAKRVARIPTFAARDSQTAHRCSGSK